MKTAKSSNQSYSWHGTTLNGQHTSGEIAAYSINLAKMYLAKKGIRVIQIHKKSTQLLRKQHTIRPFDIILFFRQFSTLIAAGIPIVQAIAILNQNKEQTKLFPVLSVIKNDITAGNGFAYSLRKFPQYFDEITCGLIYAGEKTGTLEIILDQIAKYKEKIFLLKNQIQQALFYPVMIFIVAITITLIMLIFIVPHFAELFSSMHSELPAFTVTIIYLAHFLQHYLLSIILVLLSCSGFLYYMRHTPQVIAIKDRLLLNTPGLSMALHKFILARFARSLAILFAAGIPITEALKILAPTTGNISYTQVVQKLFFDISGGQQLHIAMQTYKLFPRMMLQMIQVGEESGTLEKMLIKIAEFYESDLNHFIAHLNRLLEPLIMLVLGVLIGGLVIAMYLPIFKLGAIV